MSTDLSVNLNKIALIRNSRPGNFPNVVKFGQRCLDEGANGLTVHPRPDQRHIRPGDCSELAKLIKQYESAEFNIEGNPFASESGSYPGLLKLIEQCRPNQATLVPDGNAQLTSDHGFDLTQDAERLAPIIEQCHEWGIRVSLFMDPDTDQIKLAKEINADRIELYTGPYAEAYSNNSKAYPNNSKAYSNNSNELEEIFNRYKLAAQFAQEIGLLANAGHDLNLENLPRFLTIEGIAEVSIGHALTVDALEFGFSETVKRYATICQAQRK